MTRPLVFLLLFHLSTSVFGQESDNPGGTKVAEVTRAGQKLIDTLDETQRAKLIFDFDDSEQRRRWSNLPSGIYERKGIRWGDLNDKQKEAVFALLRTTLSKRGFQQIVDNMEGDEILNRPGPRRRVVFGRDEYFVSLLGTPSNERPWMWQFGGHHLAINVTIYQDKITLSPSLTGGQPVDYELNGRKVRQLAGEEDKCFELIASFNPNQLKTAVLDDDHADMIFGPGKEGSKPSQEGICAADLSDSQRELLLQLIEKRIGILNNVHAKPVMRQISKDIDETWFAWFGPTKPGSASSFRIQAPTILMEYAPQHLGGDATNHTHAMYRDPTNDYGAQYLKK